MWRNHIRFKVDRVLCIEIHDVFRNRPVRCGFLNSKGDGYCCSVGGFRSSREQRNGNIRMVEGGVIYSFGKMECERIASWNFCIYRLFVLKTMLLKYMPVLSKLMKN